MKSGGFTPTRRTFLVAAAGAAALGCSSGPSGPSDGVTRYVRFQHGSEVQFGILTGERIQPIAGDLFGAREPAGDPLDLADVKLLYPVEPSKIIALAGNYSDHLAEGAELPPHPEPFYKPISSLQNPEDPVVLPPDSRDVHPEAEFVIVIGKKAKNVSPEQADDYILGYTIGDDVSERNWQNGSLDGPENKDLQWWRGKGSDTFSPVGPVIAAGLDWKTSRMQARVNGEIRQDTTLDHLIHGPAETVSFISKFVTLEPGDLIFTGTTGRTQPVKAGDVIEIEIDGIGVLRNPVT